VVKLAGRSLAPHLKALMAAWLASAAGDQHGGAPAAANYANQALDQAFPGGGP